MARMRSQNVLQIAVEAKVSGRIHVNVWHMLADEEPTRSDEDVVRDFANNWQDHMLGNLSQQYVLEAFNWLSLDPDDNNVGTLMPDPAKAVTGLETNITAPPNVALLIHKNTDNRPRGARDGRSYMGGVPENLVGPSGVVDPAFVTEWNAGLQLFLDGISDDASVGGVQSRQHPVVLETTPASRAPGINEVLVNAREITSLTLDPLAATQRDRLR